jgi:hypothetical protein
MRITRLAAIGAATAVIAGAAVVLGVAGASAAPPAGTLGTLSFQPASGTDVVAIQVTTSAGCAQDADGYNIFVRGPGAFGTANGGQGFLITSTNSANFSTTAPMTIAFGENMKDAATDLGTTLVAGEYPVIFQCVDTFLGDVKGTFTGSLTFTSPTAYNTGGSTSTTTTTTTTSTTTTTTAATTTTTTDTTTDTSTTTTEPAATTTTTPVPVAANSTLAQTGAPVGWEFAIGVVLILQGLLYLLAGRRRRA